MKGLDKPPTHLNGIYEEGIEHHGGSDHDTNSKWDFKADYCPNRSVKQALSKNSNHPL